MLAGSAISPRAGRLPASPRPAPGCRLKPMRPAMNSPTAISSAALSTVGAAPPVCHDARAPAPVPGKRSKSGASKVSWPMRGEIEPRRRTVDALRPGQAMRDRNAHVGRAELRDHRAVAEFDQAMHHRLRMHQHVDLFGRHREQMMRLDQLEALVHQARRIDGDLRPHRPIGMAQRLLGRGGLDLRAASRCGTGRPRR